MTRTTWTECVRQLLGISTSGKARRRQLVHSAVCPEILEARQVPAAVSGITSLPVMPTTLPIGPSNSQPTASLNQGVLTITGNDSANTIDVTKSGTTINVLGKSFAIGSVSRIVIDGKGGNDVIQVSEAITLPTSIYGGDGADKILGGSGNDVVFGGAGADIIRTRGGSDQITGGSGNDVVDGGAGYDVMTDYQRGDKLTSIDNTGVVGPRPFPYLLQDATGILRSTAMTSDSKHAPTTIPAAINLDLTPTVESSGRGEHVADSTRGWSLPKPNIPKPGGYTGYKTNKFEKKDAVEAGGWGRGTSWSNDITETDVAKGAIAAGVSIYTANPAAFTGWVKNLVERTIASLGKSLTSTVKSAVIKAATDVIKAAISGKADKEFFKRYDTVDFKAGAITYTGQNYLLGNKVGPPTFGMKIYIAFRIR